MSIALRGTATNSTDGATTLTVNMPAGTVTGDFMVAHVSYYQGTALSSVTPPVGWDTLRNDYTHPDSSGVSGLIFTKVASGSEPSSYTFTFQDFRTASAGIASYSGVKTALPIDSSDVAIALATAAPASPSLNTIYTNPWLVWCLAARDNLASDSAAAPAGMTQRWRTNPPTDLGGVSVLADEVFGGPGNTGTRTGSISPAADTVTQAFLLSPADENPDHAPHAAAGPDRNTDIGSSVTFDGSGSSDVDPGDTLTYAWTHISGPNGVAQLSDSAAASPLFTPVVTGTDIFRLTVTDSSNSSASDDVTVSTTPAGVFAASDSGQSTTMSAPVPAQAQAGDVAFFATSSPPVPGVFPLAGWSAVRQSTQGTSSGDINIFVFTKLLEADDLGTTVGVDIDIPYAVPWTAQLITVRGLNPDVLWVQDLATQPLLSPQQITPTVVGAVGSATYTYTITAIDAGGETVAAGEVTANNAPDTLTGSNYVKLTWIPSARATEYNIYGRIAGSQQLLGTVTNANVTGNDSDYMCGYNDTGATPGSQTPPTQKPQVWVMDGLGDDNAGVPMPERLFATYDGARVLMLGVGRLNGSNPTVTVGDPAGVDSIATTVDDPTGSAILHSAIKTLSTAGDAGAYVFTTSDFTERWTTIGIVLRPTGTNGAPKAIAGFGQLMETGMTVHLDASQSYDDDGDTPTYSWAQTAGPTVSLANSTSQFPSFTMPDQDVTFRLTITDSGGLTDTDTVTITAAMAGNVKVLDSNGDWQAAPSNTP